MLSPLGVLLFLPICVVSVLSSDTNISYSNEWIVKTSLSEEELQTFSAHRGFKVARKLIDDIFLLIHVTSPKSSRSKSTWLSKALTNGSKIEHVEQLVWNQRSLRAAAFTVDDAKWNDMWYINRNSPPSMNILESWKSGYTGVGVTIAIVDDGVNFNHPDLKRQYIEGLSANFYDNKKLQADGSHGTQCAGIALAAKNKECVIGMAYDSKMVVYKMIGPYGATQAGEISALSRTADIDIFSNSWGAQDRSIFEGPTAAVTRAMHLGCTSGRNGKGAIYVFAGGNGGFNDNCNCDGFVNSIYTIAINSVSIDAKPPGYAEPCSAIMASTYSGPGGTSNNIYTTDVGGGCTDSFTGTSASTPMAAGVIALLLQANSNLTWRDVQELIVRTSNSNDLKDGQFKKNGVGRNVSDWFGYGMLDALALINAGKSLTLLSKQHICAEQITSENKNIKASVKPRIIGGTLSTDGCNQTSRCVNSLEHVQVSVTFQSSLRGSVALTLQSPLGTVSEVLTIRGEDKTANAQLTWTYMSVQFWGEEPVGEWKLNMSIASDWRQSGTLINWKLTMYGTGDGCTINNPRGQSTVTTVVDKRKSSTSTNISFGLGLGIGLPLTAFIIYLIIRLIICRLSTDLKQTVAPLRNTNIGLPQKKETRKQ